ncbi:MAG: rhodanese-like domain-containing protein [Bacteroidetes bacterium]|nr:rhodanese-like domain-containing protein [Bacteroidota bacterium]
MKKKLFSLIGFVLAPVVFIFLSCFQQSDPWTEKQLMQPADLAKIISDSTAKKPYIYSIGPSATIPYAIDIGPGKEKGNIEKLKQQLSKLPKDANIVIYCGCCPFAPCPNVRPAFALLNEMKFTNHKLLNLSQNFKADWLDKGYPVKK